MLKLKLLFTKYFKTLLMLLSMIGLWFVRGSSTTSVTPGLSDPPLALAACSTASICDAPPGGCSGTCNGGQTCKVADSSACFWNCIIDTENSPYNLCIPGTEFWDCQLGSTCTEITWTSCCSPGDACGDGICNGNGGETSDNCGIDCGGTGSACGDGTCDAGSEDCSTCTADCGTCPLPPGGSCGDGSCGSGEDCSNCSADCGSCTPPPSCGDGTCNNGESCGDCSADCGVCPPVCGDGVCENIGFDVCDVCTADCGSCNSNWFQVRGSINAENSGRASTAIKSNIPFVTCLLDPNCTPYLLLNDDAGTPESAGIPLAGSGIINSNGYLREGDNNIFATNTAISRVQENYFYFYRQFSMGLTPGDDFLGTANDAQKPDPGTSPPSDNKRAYFHSGDMTISSRWDVTAGEEIVIFVDGDLTISDPDNTGELITVAEGGFLGIVVTGDILISSDVGHSVLSNTSGNVEGIYVADGWIRTVTAGASSDKKFIGEGSFVGWAGIDLQRDLGTANNQTIPAETFVFRPDFIDNLPERMKRSPLLWQETN